MKNFKDIVLIAVISVLTIGSVICFAESSSKKSVGQLIDTLANVPNENARTKAAYLLGEAGDTSANNALVQSILTDSSYRVRIASITAFGRIQGRRATELYKEQDKGIRNAAETQSEISELKRQYSTPLKELFNPSYKFNCDYPNEVKAAAGGGILDEPEDLSFVLGELKRHCALSFEKRQEKEAPRPARGDSLTMALITLISRPNMVRVTTASRLVYSRNRNRDIVPTLREEISHAGGDYKYSLIIILSKIGTQSDYSESAKGYVPVYQFEKELLPQCEEGLLTTESPGIRRELVGILIAHGYVPASAEAQKIIDEVSAEKEDINIKY